MTDNKISKLRKSRSEASEKIRRRIDIGKELKCQRLFRPQFRKVRFQFFLLKFERCQIP